MSPFWENLSFLLWLTYILFNLDSCEFLARLESKIESAYSLMVHYCKNTVCQISWLKKITRMNHKHLYDQCVKQLCIGICIIFFEKFAGFFFLFPLWLVTRVAETKTPYFVAAERSGWSGCIVTPRRSLLLKKWNMNTLLTNV